MGFYDKDIKKQKAIIITIMVLLFLAFAAVGVVVGVPLVKSASEPEHFREWIKSLGFLGDGAYIILVILQVVVALIPGEPIEILGGYAFGIWRGTVLYLIGAFIGSVIVFLLVRKFGKIAAEIFFSKEKLESLKILQTSPKRTLIFSVIFTIPGTPKDLLAYFVGLTDMKLSTWLIIAAFGRIPSAITSTISGSALGDGKYTSLIITLAVTLVLSLAGLLVYKFIIGKNEK
ncbi:MAG: TVP38/TMEM64 family protein [Clostridia bacterium]|nr:TVP38/TMEM64 family protein [Clostridia bacterium]